MAVYVVWIMIFSLLTSGMVPQLAGHNETLVNHITALLDNILNHYDRNFRPRTQPGEPLVVTVDIEVRSMGPISEKDMEFSMDCYFRQHWTDTRLAYTGPLKELSLNANFLRSIWRPDTYVRNGKKSYLHTLTVPNILLRIADDGTVRVSQRLTIKTICPMYLKKFPMDVQACLVELGSMAYATNDVIYRWAKPPVIDEDVELSQYTLKGAITTERIVPSYRDPEESVMTVLTMSTMSLGGRNELPPVSYSTALDTYVVGCFAFVFFALVEYAVINFAHFFHMANAVNQLRQVTTALMTTSKDSSAPASSLMAAFVMEETTLSTATQTQTVLSPTSGFSNVDLDDDDTRLPPPNAFVLKRRQPSSCANARNAFRQISNCCTRRMRSSKVTDPGIDVPNNNNTKRQNGALWSVSDEDSDMDEDDEDENSDGIKCCKSKGQKRKKRNPDTEMDWIDDLAKVLFPAAYLLFNGIYWLAFYYLDDEIDSIPAIRDTSLHILAAPAASGNGSGTGHLAANATVFGLNGSAYS